MEREKKKIGIITLAISLIGVGLIFLLDNYFDLGPLKDIGLLWPVILIIFGLELIITKAIYSSKGDKVKLSVDALSLVLIIIVILVSAAVNIASNIGSPFVGCNFDGIKLGIGIDNFKYKDTIAFSSGPIDIDNIASEKIIINNYSGDINIVKADDDSLLVKADIEVGSNDRNLAKGYLENAIEISTDGAIEISTQLPNDRNKISGPMVNYTIYVPQGIDIAVINRMGSVKAEGLSNALEIDNKNGSIDVRDIHGNVDLATSLGNIAAKGVTGYIVANNKSGSITVVEVKGEVDLKTSLGSISMENLNGKISASTSNGSIELDNTFNLEDDVSLSTSFGSIQMSCPPISNATVKANTGSGSIRSKDLLDIDKQGSSYTGRAVLGNGSKNINLTTGNGSITINEE